MRFQPVRQRHKAYTMRNAVGKTRETCIWHQILASKLFSSFLIWIWRKEVRKNSFSNPALSLSFLQNKFINLCKQSLWPQVLRNISFFFQKLPHLPSSKQPRETWPTPPFWQSQKNLLASQDSCPASFLTINNLHVLNGVPLERSATSVSLYNSHIFVY